MTQSLKRKIWWGGSKFISYILLSLESLLFSQSECFQRGREDDSALLCNCNTCNLAGRWGWGGWSREKGSRPLIYMYAWLGGIKKREDYLSYRTCVWFFWLYLCQWNMLNSRKSQYYVCFLMFCSFHSYHGIHPQT